MLWQPAATNSAAIWTKSGSKVHESSLNKGRRVHVKCQVAPRWKGIINLSIVLGSLGWRSGLLAPSDCLHSLSAQLSGEDNREKTHQDSAGASDTKNTRRFLWDDNSKRLWSTRLRTKNLRELKRAEAPHIMSATYTKITSPLHVFYASKFPMLIIGKLKFLACSL